MTDPSRPRTRPRPRTRTRTRTRSRSRTTVLSILAAVSTATLSLLPVPAARAAGPGLADTRESPHARIRGIGLDEVRWTRGFWAERLAVCRERMVPAMGSIMEGTDHSQFIENFRIAVGLAEGRHRGPPWNDGDLYKWLEAACALLATGADGELEARIEEIISLIARTQRADGYLHTPVLIRQRNGDGEAAPFQDRFHFEMYNLGHLMTAACVHHRVTGRSELLAVARKAADFLDRTFPEPTAELVRHAVCPAHSMGVVELYRTTREPRYLELARRLFASRDLVTDGGDDNQDRIPFAQQTEAVGHAVRANYLYAGAADLFAETGDRSLWEPLGSIWSNVVEKKLYVTGGCGALYDGASPDGSRNQKVITRVHQAYGRNYQLPSLTAHNETCANIGNVLWNWRMHLITGEARYIDVLELALHNSVLSGVSLDGTLFFYVNPLQNLERPPTRLRWSRTRVPYINSFCCPPNVVRTVAETAAYAYGVTDDAIRINLYGGNTVRTRLPAGEIALAQETDYPWDGRVELAIEKCPDSRFAIELRIPGWAGEASVRVNGEALAYDRPRPGTYVSIRRIWRPGDRVRLDLPMPPVVIESHPLVEETRNQVAIKRGPLVYCLESRDLPPGTRVLEAEIPTDLRLKPVPGDGVLDGMTLLEGTIAFRDLGEWDGALYRERAPRPVRRERVRLVPYFAWANRGEGEMTVWLPAETVTPPADGSANDRAGERERAGDDEQAGARENDTARSTVELWGLFEISLRGPHGGNPFRDVELSARFSHGSVSREVSGFYDGDGTYRIRFMPDRTGRWHYRSRSNRPELDGREGEIEVGPPAPGNHGPVRIANTFHFAHADGTPYRPIGTTCYAWIHQSDELQEQTLATLASSPFNKLRMCVFPKRYAWNENEPPRYPFEGTPPRSWDFARYSPEFFRNLERRVAQLRDLGIEADLILFHPYDKGHWGYDRMGDAEDDHYLRHVVSRLAAFRNVWWSLANEYDFMETKEEADWDRLFRVLEESDPYGRLRSIHNGYRIYNHTRPWVTHASIQNGSAVEDAARAVLYRDVYRKPVVFDEVKYEGDIPRRWGNISAEEMVQRFWEGTIAGTYVGHGETYLHPSDVLWWSKGGVLRGESPRRLAFLRAVLEGAPDEGIDPIDKWQNPRFGGRTDEYYLLYFGAAAPARWPFELPKRGLEDGMRFRVEVLDTWNMTVEPLDEVFAIERKDGYFFADVEQRAVRLPGRPWMALRIRRAPGAKSAR